MTQRLPTMMAAMLIPAFAFGGDWDFEPQNIWLPTELAWAQPHQPDGMSPVQIEASLQAPPRPAWCGISGLQYPPTPAACDAYDADLTDWLIDFTDTTTAADVAHIAYPPTWCGGC